jgi:hypothetical protein
LGVGREANNLTIQKELFRNQSALEADFSGGQSSPCVVAPSGRKDYLEKKIKLQKQHAISLDKMSADEES